MTDADVNTDCIGKFAGQTGHAIIQVTGDGQNSMLLCHGANRKLDKNFVDRALGCFAKSDVL